MSATQVEPPADAYRLIVQQAPFAIALLDLAGTVIEVNPATEQLLGYERDAIVGRPCAPFTHPEDYVAEKPLLEAVLDGDSDGYEIEKRYLRADGSHVRAQLILRAVRDPDGAATHLLAIMRNTEEQTLAESEQRIFVERLWQARRLEAIGRLAGGIAHDFNNLLTVMMGHAGLALDHADATVRSELVEILAAGERASELVRQLLTFARKQPADPRLVDLNAVVGEATAALGAHDAAVRIATELAPTPLPVVVDRDQLEQALHNLVANARDAMPDGGTLSIRTLADQESVVLSIEDTGTGMNAETRARAFEPFYTTKDHGAGNGLGLATAYSIVESAAGTIRVASEPGEGTRVEIVLPLAR